MPADAGGGINKPQGERTVFRPPWVKDGANTATTPSQTAPWALRNNKAKEVKETAAAEKAAPTSEEPSLPFKVQLRKTSGPRQNGEVIREPTTLPRPTLNPVPPKEPKSEPKNIPIQREDRPKLTNQRTINDNERNIPIKTNPSPTRTDDKVQARKTIEKEITRAPTLRKQDSLKSIIPSPPAPPMPPPPPKQLPPGYKPLDPQKAQVIEQLRSRPRRRPDWGQMMKDIEAGKKLKHVVSNDRSKPLLPAGKAKTIDGQFVYESEKANLHNQLLKQIQSGVNLKRVQTNDRSRPVLDGLRKFRRQLTIEEQIQKSQSVATIPDAEEIADEEDEMDDIDKIRDDLQSTKQLLALELRNKEAQVKENKRLQARILNLEVELERERGKAAASVTRSVMAERIEDEKLVTNLKQEADDARKAAKESEKKYLQATDQLDTIKGELEESRRQTDILQKKLEAALKALEGGSRRESQAPDPEMQNSDEESMTESEDDGEETEEKKERRAKRELKMLTNKLSNFKDKEGNARRERQSLKEQMKKQQELIREERKKYKHLQREVDKMAALMKDDDDEDAEEKEVNDDEDDDDGSVEEEEETESESESSSESEDDEEKSASESEDAPLEKRKENYTSRIWRHENCLAALKKGNYLLKANIDRLKDDLNKQREMSNHLQQDLDSVLSELG